MIFNIFLLGILIIGTYILFNLIIETIKNYRNTEENETLNKKEKEKEIDEEVRNFTIQLIAFVIFFLATGWQLDRILF